MFGTIINSLAIIAGGMLGVVFRNGIPTRYHQTIMHAIGLTVMIIGITSALKTDALLIVVFSMVLGSVIGEMANIEMRLERIGSWIEKRMGGMGANFTRGFVTASLIYCVGAMAIVGSLESGLTGNHQTLFAKAVLDGVTSVVFASTFGMGVLFSAISVFAYQGAITICATYLKPYLTPEVIHQMSAVGGLLIMGIGINLLELKKIKIGNMLPAIFLPFAYYLIRQLSGI